MQGLFGLSPRGLARLAGIFEALEGITSAIGSPLGLPGRLVVHGDAATTAHNILTQQALFQAGFASSLIAVPFHIAWGLLFYYLFRPVNRALAALAAIILVVGCALQAATAVTYIAPLVVLQDSSSSAQLAMMLADLHVQAFNVYLIFFGFWCVVSGYLIFRSGFIPSVLGLLLMLDGIGWSLYLVPPLAAYLFGVIAVVAAFAEFPLQLWLIIFGANVPRWIERARLAAATSP